MKLLVTLARAGDDPRGRLTEALDIMNQLKSQGLLQPAHRQWIADIEDQLAKLGRRAVHIRSNRHQRCGELGSATSRHGFFGRPELPARIGLRGSAEATSSTNERDR